MCLQLYERAVELLPAYPEALCNLGVVHKNAGRLQEAVSYYEKSLAGATPTVAASPLLHAAIERRQNT